MACSQYLLIVLEMKLSGLNKLLRSVLYDQFIEALGVSSDILSWLRDRSIGNSWLESSIWLYTVLIASEGILATLDVTPRVPF